MHSSALNGWNILTDTEIEVTDRIIAKSTKDIHRYAANPFRGLMGSIAERSIESAVWPVKQLGRVALSVASFGIREPIVPEKRIHLE